MLRKRGFAPLALALGLALTGCGEDGALIGDEVPNTAPDTRVTATPPVLGQTTFTVTFFWTGSDPDGEIRGFEWRISSNGADGVVDVADTLGLPWAETTATDTTFVVSADMDSFEIDANDPRIQDPKQVRFWQTHTLYVRAVDELGARDPSPAHVSFTATTLAPTVNITLPSQSTSTSCTSAPEVMTFGWEGVDPDNPDGTPAEVRYILLPYGGPGTTCLPRQQFQQGAFPITGEEAGWSDWVRYDAPNDSGLTVTLPRQQQQNSFFFAVQARDVAGAVTPTFEWGRNVRHVRVDNSSRPRLIVSEQFLGTFEALSINTTKSFEIVQGQPINFSWSADASSYAGLIEAYRYGWDLVDPNDPNDPGWAVAWGNGPQWLRALERSFSQGAHNFVVQARDNSGTISRLFVGLQVIQIPSPSEQRELLLVDDWPFTSGNQQLQAEWLNRMRSWVDNVVGFQPADVIDVELDANRMNFRLVSNYKSIVWLTAPAENNFIQTRLAPENTGALRYNFMEVYQARVGRMLLMGPGAAINSVEHDPPNWAYPLVFNSSAGGNQGFGRCERPDGTEFPCGIQRWPYSAFCLDIADPVRPAIQRIFNEGAGNPQRSWENAGLAKAVVDTTFRSRNAIDPSELVDLQPTSLRLQTQQPPDYKLFSEEYYNRLVVNRDVTVNLRACQEVMFRWVSRMDPSIGAGNPSVLRNQDPRVGGSPTGVRSTAYSQGKPIGGNDYIWGFHPLAFTDADVRTAVQWIVNNDWQLDTTN